MILSDEDLGVLLAVAHFYEKSMGPMRYVVGLTTAPGMRKRLRFIKEESLWLERFAEGERANLGTLGRDEVRLELTPRAAVAFWGRLLASLNSKRSKRKLSAEEVERRSVLAAKIRDTLLEYGRKHPYVVDREIGTRRAPEQIWMRDALG